MAESRRIPGGAPAERLPLPLGLAQTEILYPAAAGRGIAASVDGGVVPLDPERFYRGGGHGSSPRAKAANPTSRHPAHRLEAKGLGASATRQYCSASRAINPAPTNFPRTRG